MANDQHGSQTQCPPPEPDLNEEASLAVAHHQRKDALASTAQGQRHSTPAAPALQSAKETEQLEMQKQDISSAASAAQDQGRRAAAGPHNMAEEFPLLVEVLSYLPPHEYLCSCSLVCHAWHAAAVQAATQELIIDSDPDSLRGWHEQRFTPDTKASFVLWLNRHGAQVQRLCIDASRCIRQSVWTLPLGQLQRLQMLELVNCQLKPLHTNSSGAHHLTAAALQLSEQQQQQELHVGLHSSTNSSNGAFCQASLADLSSLHSLSLQGVDYQLSGGLACLSALTNLQLLWLGGISWPYQQQQQQQQQDGDAGQQQQGQQQLGVEVLSSLTQLTSLAVDVGLLPVDAAAPHACLQQLANLTRLRSLRLHCNHGLTRQMRQGLRSLAALTNLRVLELVGACEPTQPQQQHSANDHQQQQQQQHHADDEFGFFSALTQLTQLDLRAGPLPADAAESLACLQQLQLLRVHCRSRADTAVLVGLPQSITQLCVAWDDQAPFSSSSVRALASSLPALQVLDVFAKASSGGMQVGLCSSMSQLRKLRLWGTFHNALSSDLLDVVPYLPGLDELSITACDAYNAINQPRPLSDLSRYSGLLASTPKLTQLSFVWLTACMLPVGCGQHLFAERVQLPQLKQLVLGAPLRTAAVYLPDFFSEDHWGFAAIQACFGRGDVARMVRCCPALELLSIPGLVEPGVDMSPLTRLTRLRQLYVGGEAIDDVVARSVLAKMPQLRQLEVCGAPELTDAGVLALSSNTALIKLLLVGCGLSSAMPVTPCGGTRAGGPNCFLVRQQAGAGSVHVQLLENCTRSVFLHPLDRAHARHRLLVEKRERKHGISGPMVGPFMSCTVVCAELLLCAAIIVVNWKVLMLHAPTTTAPAAALGEAASVGKFSSSTIWGLACLPACAFVAELLRGQTRMLVIGAWRAGWPCSTQHEVKRSVKDVAVAGGLMEIIVLLALVIGFYIGLEAEAKFASKRV